MNMSVKPVILCVMYVTFYCVNHSAGYTIKLDDSNTLKLDLPKEDPTVEHFAIHGLCKHEHGRKLFVKVLGQFVCKLNEEFIVNLVHNLCNKMDEDLYMWVAELFDIDGNGHVSYHEKAAYLYK